MGGLKKRRFLCATLLFASAAAFADRPPQHAELRMAINLGKYDQAREYIKQGVKDIYCGDMPADSAKVIWAKRWKQNPELALLGCLRQYTHFYPEKACEIRGVSPNICPGRLKDSTALADPERFAALAKAALSNPEHKTRLRGEIATLGEERLIALADEARFDLGSDSALPEKMAAWAGMLRDLQRKFKLFGDGEKDYYPGSEKWMKSERARERITSYRKRKVAADAGQSEKLLQKAPTRGDTESQTVHLLKIVEVVDYTPTGRRIVVYSDGAPTTPQFTGKEMDTETGLYHFGARQYDPELALWAQVDPGRQFASPYAYAGNGVNPINGVDPSGKKFVYSSLQTFEFVNNLYKNDLMSPEARQRFDVLKESERVYHLEYKPGKKWPGWNGGLANGKAEPALTEDRRTGMIAEGGECRFSDIGSFFHETIGHLFQFEEKYQDGMDVIDVKMYLDQNRDALEYDAEMMEKSGFDLHLEGQ